MHDDLVERKFTASVPNRLWLTDIPEHPTGEGKLYLCAVKDVYSERIVGYSIDSRMKAALAVTALRSALARLDGPGGIVPLNRLIMVTVQVSDTPRVGVCVVVRDGGATPVAHGR